MIRIAISLIMILASFSISYTQENNITSSNTNLFEKTILEILTYALKTNPTKTEAPDKEWLMSYLNMPLRDLLIAAYGKTVVSSMASPSLPSAKPRTYIPIDFSKPRPYKMQNGSSGTVDNFSLDFKYIREETFPGGTIVESVKEGFPVLIYASEGGASTDIYFMMLRITGTDGKEYKMISPQVSLMDLAPGTVIPKIPYKPIDWIKADELVNLLTKSLVTISNNVWDIDGIFTGMIPLQNSK